MLCLTDERCLLHIFELNNTSTFIDYVRIYSYEIELRLSWSLTTAAPLSDESCHCQTGKQISESMNVKHCQEEDNSHPLEQAQQQIV